MDKAFRKICINLHLWMGLLSGGVVFVVCITGCMYAFKDEINHHTQHWRFVEPEKNPRLFPSQILNKTNREIKNENPTAITYGEPFDAVSVDYFNPEKGISKVFINPYNGKILKVIQENKNGFDFFKFVLTGHRSLWLPKEIGKPIVGYSVLVFTITLITGGILWWPRKWNKKTLRKNVTIRTKKSSFLLNWDLHNVLGGYSFLVLLILCLTGLVWSFNWYSQAVYYLTSGGKELQPYTLPQSDSLHTDRKVSVPLDQLYSQLSVQEPYAKTFYFALPSSPKDIIRVSIVHERNSYYKTDNLFFDQYTLKPLKGSGPYAGKYTQATFPDKLRRMNLELHDGRILGLPGKIIVFTAALIGASLPVTGILIWYGKIKKKRSKKTGKSTHL